jgi:hypothetical protein
LFIYERNLHLLAEFIKTRLQEETLSKEFIDWRSPQGESVKKCSYDMIMYFHGRNLAKENKKHVPAL